MATMSEKSKRSLAKLKETQRKLYALKALAQRSVVSDRLLAKLGLSPLDQFRAQVKKNELIRIIRAKLKLKHRHN